VGGGQKRKEEGRRKNTQKLPPQMQSFSHLGREQQAEQEHLTRVTRVHLYLFPFFSVRCISAREHRRHGWLQSRSMSWVALVLVSAAEAGRQDLTGL